MLRFLRSLRWRFAGRCPRCGGEVVRLDPLSLVVGDRGCVACEWYELRYTDGERRWIDEGERAREAPQRPTGRRAPSADAGAPPAAGDRGRFG